jgi:single-stranded-DNA-specific exonuclease
MKYKLIKPVNKEYNVLQQVLTNRGIDINDIEHYINTTDDDINSPLSLGEASLKAAFNVVNNIIYNKLKALIVVDSDCDGYTSAALLSNYLYDLSPSWVTDNLSWYIHSGKQHGLNDCIDFAKNGNYSLIFLPDSGSNDYEYHEELYKNNIQCIVIDHHEAPRVSEYAITLNNQLSDYPNKQLAGAGIVWQFCRYMDSILNCNYSNKYIDLVALSATADMMSLLSIETKHLINKGFEPNNINNPFIKAIWEKNHFKLGDYITSWGAAFYIAPFVNAIVRSGTQEEKEIVFNSMLNFKAYNIIPSTKRGHKVGDTETVVEQAMRICTNVKNRQTKNQDLGMKFLEEKIKEDDMLKHKVLLFLIEPGQIDKNIAGLCANKVMAKYQRPCCVLTKVEETDKADTEMYTKISYQGSARGCDIVGITEFKDICESSGLTLFVAGHQGAFGLGLRQQDIEEFITITDRVLENMPSEPIYYVDYIYENDTFDSNDILTIADMDCYWGKDIQESLVVLKDLKVTKSMVSLMSPDKHPTLKIKLNNGVEIIKFGSSQEEFESFYSEGYIKVDIIGKCKKNEWNGFITPQILIEDYEILSNIKYLF